eukprot:TRINITY_DN27123_c0_g1_i1.p1 TRINITY_DN27123_c0_g1~~TRINITY_DN27123_c0_g1_i1.p1  ORF type:complete len:565 (+),score=109.34 TRINITY_DN27123_c0_g1_i1:64-1695(+)
MLLRRAATACRSAAARQCCSFQAAAAHCSRREQRTESRSSPSVCHGTLGAASRDQSHALPSSRLCSIRRFASSSGQAGGNSDERKVEQKKQSLLGWMWEQVLHIYHGFRLLAVNVRVTSRLKRQMNKGQKLTRREKQLLKTTTEDMLRLVPFSMFIIIPGGELLLPVALAMFPNLMPSTFDTSDQRRRRQIMQNLSTGIARRRIFEHMAITILNHENFEASPRILDVFRACTKGGVIEGEDLKTFARYFKDDGPLCMKKLPYHVLSDLAVLLHVMSRARARFEGSFLPRQFVEANLGHALERELMRMEEDDRGLSEDDIAIMTPKELEQECSRRKMRWVGPPEALRKQLLQWRELSLDLDVPNHLLIFLYPCATESDVMIHSMSQSERDHILGLTKFQATPMYLRLKDVVQEISSKSTKSQAVLQRSIDDVQKEAQYVMQEEEATVHEFDELREALREITDEELCAMFDEALQLSPKACSKVGNDGIDLETLVAILRKGGAAKTFSTRSAVLEMFGSDGECVNSLVIQREDFQAFVSRIRMEE